MINSSAPEDDVSGVQFCTGVLVSADQVLTAAHCVRDRAPATMDAVVAADNLCRTEPVGGIRVHVASARLDTTVDGALLTLKTPVGIIPAHVTSPTPREGEPLAAWGWGKDSVGGVAPCRAEPKDLVTVPLADCVGSPSGVSPDYLCATPEQGRNTCEGDSGGPAFAADGALVALTASGLGCGPSDPGTYALAAPLLIRLRSFAPSADRERAAGG